MFGFVARQTNGSFRPAFGGFVLSRAVAGEAEILTIGVEPRYARSGLGWRLMQAAMREALVKGSEALFLEVDETNQAAIGLYRKLGELPPACVSIVSLRDQPRETVSGAVGAPPPASTYRVGMRVMHPMFGLGTVRKCDESGTEEKLIVQFERGGIKKLVARFARLQIVDTAA